jgi:hypothetical protein
MKMENPSRVTAHRIEKFLQGPKIFVSASSIASLLSYVQHCELPKRLLTFQDVFRHYRDKN